MSKKNIIDRKDVGNKVQLTFENPDGNRTYEYAGQSARAIRKGKDPASLSGGKLINHEKKS
jgi:hypothetical protein